MRRFSRILTHDFAGNSLAGGALAVFDFCFRVSYCSLYAYIIYEQVCRPAETSAAIAPCHAPARLQVSASQVLQMARVAERRPCGGTGHTTAASNKMPRMGPHHAGKIEWSSLNPRICCAPEACVKQRVWKGGGRRGHNRVLECLI